MALTQISTAGVKDDAVTAGKIPANAVGSSELADNAVDNAAVASNAAIAGTKIAPDFGSQNITTTGTVGSGDITISGTAPRLIFTDSNNDSDFRLNVDAGLFSVQDTSNSFASRFEIGSDGRFRVGTTAQPSGTVGGFQLDMGSYPGTARLMSGAGASGTETASLAIGGSNHNASIENGANSGAQINLYNYNSTDGNSSAVSFLNSNGLSASRVLGLNVSHSSRTGNLVFMTSNGSHPVEAMRLTHDGKLAIGTTSPDNLLHLESSSNPYLQLEKVGTSSKVYVGNASGDAIIESTGGAVKLKPNGASNKFILDTSGRLLLGTSNTDNAFSGGDSLVIGNTSDRSGITLVSSTSNDGGLYFSKGTSANSDNVKGQIVYQHDSNGGYMRFYANAGERVRIQSGGGISFNGDTAAANALDDYEVGSWTPSAASGSFTVYNQAWYIKIGKLVTCYFYVYSFSDTSSNTAFVLGGLPYAYNNSPKHESFHDICIGGHAANFPSSTIGITGRIGQGSTTEMQFNVSKYNAAGQSLTHSMLGSCHLHTTFCYEAA